MLKKTFYALIAFFLFVFGFVSCSFNEKQTNVSIKIPSQVCNTIFSAREADSSLVKQSIQVKLYVNSKPAFQKTSEYDGKDLSLSFDSIHLGAQVYAEAFFLEKEGDVEKIIASAKSNTITVKKTSNNLEVVITLEKVEPDDPGNTTEPDDPGNTTEPDDPTKPDDPSQPETPKLYDYYDIPVNDSWHFSAFNEYQDDMVTCKSASEDSITFTLNRPLTQPDGMLQVNFGDKAYEKDKTYVCSYKIQGPVPDGATAATMNVCCWVTKEQAGTFSSYNNTSPAETSFSFVCDTSENGGLLFFPEIPGEYTISDLSVIEVDPSAQEMTLCNLEIKVAEASAFEDIQVTVAEGSENIVFTAPEGFTSYSWQLKFRGEQIQTSNTNKLVIEVALLTKGNYYDLILFADNKSYTRQIKISE